MQHVDDKHIDTLVKSCIHPCEKFAWDSCKMYTMLKVREFVDTKTCDSTLIRPSIVGDNYVGEVRKHFVRLNKTTLNQTLLQIYKNTTRSLCEVMLKGILFRELTRQELSKIEIQVEQYCNGAYFAELLITEESIEEYIKYFYNNFGGLRSMNMSIRLTDILFTICKHESD